MQDVETVIILAAGSSRRMGDLSRDKPKCLLSYRDVPLLTRLIQQLKKNGIKQAVIVVGYQKGRVIETVRSIKGMNIVIVENDRYEEDVNIHSMKLALEKVSGTVVVFEADCIMEDAAVAYAVGSDFDTKSVWFTRGKFNDKQYGGILKSDGVGNIVDIRIVSHYEERYKDYSKLTGMMRIHAQKLPLFRELVNGYAARTLKQYYLIPWIDHLQRLPCIEGNAEHYLFGTFNTPAEYNSLLTMNFDPNDPRKEAIEFVEVTQLKPIERFSEERVIALMQKIQQENVWTKPLYIEKDHNIVLDGQHRLEVARRLGLKRVPVQGFRYEDVNVWTLRKEEEVTIPLVIRRALEGRIYPYKTVKHKFPNVIGECAIPLEQLQSLKVIA